jgi:hypothetical protein
MPLLACLAGAFFAAGSGAAIIMKRDFQKGIQQSLCRFVDYSPE